MDALGSSSSSEFDPMVRLAEAVEAHRAELTSALVQVETHRTAATELDWLLAGLIPGVNNAWLAQRRGIGTVFTATPATLPLYSMLLFALAPALAGNRVVVRAASASRDCVRLLLALAVEAGLPVELVEQPWAEFSATAAGNAGGVVYCGSVGHAAELDEALPEHVRLICQGPGVCAAVVTDAADIPVAARTVIATRIFNNSQDCMATERVYVHRSVYGEFIDALLTAADTVKTGPNDDPTTQLGPLLIDGLANRWLSNPTDHGTVLRSPGQDGALPGLAIFEADADAPIVLEEKYCPVLPVVEYRDDHDLAAMLTLGDYALGLTVFGPKLPRFGTLDFCHVAVDSTLYEHEDAWTPFGGHRRTTLVRGPGVRRTGPVLVPYALSEPL
ncbi:aldehyde dehydrogenase family protein [Nocardia sp. alder85J]|uniref:aldehyde dehydrogenase family protein n=1 Tax=Nocardia sp. alder85J TaxID=2862949 RepID=UPI001CD37688|nr:aldehyde dehydrogenase family protein [Nocardia sp. alder85J]MCX4093189.1 aldehyde dehydrogenase family protein [Nocardia sp. alder85J]